MKMISDWQERQYKIRRKFRKKFVYPEQYREILKARILEAIGEQTDINDKVKDQKKMCGQWFHKLRQKTEDKTDKTYWQTKLKDYIQNVSKATNKSIRKKIQQEKISKAMNKQFKGLKNQKEQQIYEKMLSFTSSQQNVELSTIRNF